MNSRYFFALTFIILILFPIALIGQSRSIERIKPAEVKSKNYKLARKLYNKSSYEAGYFSMDYKLAKKLFLGKSGIGIESIPTTDLLNVPLWQSNTYTADIETDILAGQITSVKWHKELFKEAKSNAVEWKTLKMFHDKIEIPLRPKQFSVASYGDSKDTIRNFVIIRKGKICKIQPFKNYGGTLFQAPFTKIEFQFSSQFNRQEKMITTDIIRDTISFKLFYDRNEAGLNAENTAILREQISVIEDSIISIDVTSFTSVEGNLKLNQKLYDSRVQAVLKEIKMLLKNDPEIKVRSTENWQLFRQQIEGTEFEHLAQLPKEDVRDFVNRHASEAAIETMLEEQRYTEVKISIVRKKENIIIPSTPIEYYNKLITEAKANNYKVSAKTINQLEQTQINVYTKCLNGELKYEDVDHLEIPNYQDFKTLEFNKLVLDYCLEKNKYSVKWYFNQFIKMGSEKNTPSHLKKAIQFNTQLLLFEAVQDGTLSFFLDLDQFPLKAYRDYIFKLIPASISKAESTEINERLVLNYMPGFINDFKTSRLNANEIEQLNRFYYTQLISSYYLLFYPETKREAQRQLSGIYRYFSEDKISSAEERISVAKLYMLFHNWEKAITTFAPLLNDPEFGIYANQLTLSCKQFTLSYEELIEEILSARFELGYDSWLEMFENPEILGPRYFDNAQIREYYFSR